MIGDIVLKQDELWLKFSQPRHVIVTEKVEEVRKALQEAEKLVNSQGLMAVGFVSYEAAPAFDPNQRVIASQGFPLVWFGLYETAQQVEPIEIFTPPSQPPTLHWEPNTSKNTYQAAIQSIKEKIAQGQTYQVNYTLRLLSQFQPTSSEEQENQIWQLFTHLARGQNKYAAFLDIGNYAICSASHELFFELNGNTITGRPMKGTVKRGRTLHEDRQISQWLHESIKNRAENVMIVDMIRNDIGRIAKVGSVRVPDLFSIEQYPTLFQMTSSVQAETEASVSEIFSALFPCASITGAPKVSTMKIIAELEDSPRNIYCGSIGYIAPHRNARFNVAIRTALVEKQSGKVRYGVGGGIVWDSTAADEYHEALLKAQVLTQAPQKDFSLFETLLWTPQESFFLLERHIDRISNSAEYFGFSSLHTSQRVRQFLAALVEHARTPQRVRVVLDNQGEISGSVQDFQLVNKVFQVCTSKIAVNSQNKFLFHKTSIRNMYEQAKDAGVDDVLLYNENNELTEFGIGNLVVEMAGGLFTPPVKCGLLAGTFRAELLERGEIQERIILLSELPLCQKVFLINSLRKWVEVCFV